MYRTLHSAIQTERIEEQDLIEMGMLQSLGIERGKPYAPSAEMVTMFDAAAKEAQGHLRETYLFKSGIYYPGTQWRNTFMPGMYETRYTWLYPGLTDFDLRGAMYNYSFASGERLGSGSYYINLAADSKGQPLAGANNYKLHVPANAPVTQFWSATVQDDVNGVFMDTPGRVSLGSIELGVEKNADGSVDVYFGPNAPQRHEGNWVQTEAGKNWFIMFRFYGTTPATFDKSWKMGDIETLN